MATIGVDEVGRGCLAGPLVVVGVRVPAASAEALRAQFARGVVRDSKAFAGAAARDRALAAALAALPEAPAASVWVAGAARVDRDANILRTTMAGMEAVLDALAPAGAGGAAAVAAVLVDGPRCTWARAHAPAPRCCVRGDREHAEIALASMVAKHCRDAWMGRWCAARPAEAARFGFARNQGYGTATHLAALGAPGAAACADMHRRSFLRRFPGLAFAPAAPGPGPSADACELAGLAWVATAAEAADDDGGGRDC